MLRLMFIITGLLFGTTAVQSAEKAPATEALKPFNGLVGKWKGAGVPEGSADAKQDGHWSETIEWGWKFKGDDAWMILAFDNGKYFKSGELRALAKPNTYQLTLQTIDKRSLVFEGTLEKSALRVEHIDDKTRDAERITLSLLHSNRITYTAETKTAGSTFYTKRYRVGATMEGKPFVEVGFNEKECVVSGGQGTNPVMYKGKTYYVCCSGCRDAFNEEPEKYVVEFEKKRAKFNQKP